MVRHSPMIPIKDNIRVHTFPIITTSIVFVNIAIYVMQELCLFGLKAEQIYGRYGFVPGEFLAAAQGQWTLLPYNCFTVFSSMFLHAGLLHLLGNMLYLVIFGMNVEDAMGRKRFLFFYLLSGVAATAFQFSVEPSSPVPMIGASGAVSGILGAYFVLFPRAEVKTFLLLLILPKVVNVPAILLLALWYLMQIFFSYGEGVAWYAHIGGFILGLVTGRLFIIGRKRKK